MMGIPDISGIVDAIPELSAKLDRLIAAEERQAAALEAIAKRINRNGSEVSHGRAQHAHSLSTSARSVPFD